jgi:hypothetical protein
MDLDVEPGQASSKILREPRSVAERGEAVQLGGRPRPLRQHMGGGVGDDKGPAAGDRIRVTRDEGPLADHLQDVPVGGVSADIRTGRRAGASGADQPLIAGGVLAGRAMGRGQRDPPPVLRALAVTPMSRILSVLIMSEPPKQ